MNKTIEQIVKLIDDLEKLYPSLQNRLESMAEDELEVLGVGAVKEILEHTGKIADGQDKTMQKMLGVATISAGGGGGGSVSSAGRNIGGIVNSGSMSGTYDMRRGKTDEE